MFTLWQLIGVCSSCAVLHCQSIWLLGIFTGDAPKWDFSLGKRLEALFQCKHVIKIKCAWINACL